MFGLGHRQQLFVVLVAVLVVFCIWAKVDYAVTGFRGNYLAEENIGEYWFWMWIVGVPSFSFIFALIYYAGASDTERNLVYAVGVFFTVIFLAVGQLEDFLYFVLNGHPLPVGDWTWMLPYHLFGTWTTQIVLASLLVSVVAVVAMWYYILEMYE